MSANELNGPVLDLQEKPGGAPKPEGLSAEVLRRFQISLWMGKVRSACDDAGIADKGVLDVLSLYLGERLLKLCSLAELMCDEDDMEDLRDHLVFAYVEAKSQWFQLNTIVNYEIMRGSEPDLETSMRGVVISMVIEEFDDLFGTECIDVLTEYLHAPLPNAHMLTLARKLSSAA